MCLQMTYCQPKSVMFHFAQNTYIPDRLEQVDIARSILLAPGKHFKFNYLHIEVH